MELKVFLKSVVFGHINRHVVRTPIVVAVVVILTLAHHPITGGEPPLSIDFSTFYGTEGSTFNTTRAVDVDSEGSIVFLVEGNVDPDGGARLFVAAFARKRSGP